MNFLAHQLLSGDDEGIRLGNFIADFVKGKQYKEYSAEVQIGILFHREIDWFTDNNEIIKSTSSKLRDDFGKYAGVAVDVYLDHFLGKNWKKFHSKDLKEYTLDTYQIIEEHIETIPNAARHMFRYMKRDNWLYHYSYTEGVGRALKGISKRTHFRSGLENGEEVLKRDYEYLMEQFEIFMPEVLNARSQMLDNAILKCGENP